MEYQEGNVIVEGIKIHYYRSGGKKPPMVLLYGATDDGLCWGRTAYELAERYDVIMPDAQGHGLCAIGVSNSLTKAFNLGVG
jgi:pimeloyl-ACP methyl ester carboxylesterase